MADNWYIGKNGGRSGPFTSSQVRDKAAQGELRPEDMLWKEGMANWVVASSIKGLFPTSPFPAPPPAVESFPPMPPVTAPPPAPRGAGNGNPYSAPVVGEFHVELGSPGGFNQPLPYAEFLPRVAATLLDGLFTGIMGCVPALGILVVLFAMAGDDPEAQQAVSVLFNCCFQIIYQLVALAYFVVLETSPKQGTWGKQIVGIKVTDLEGQRITIGRAIGRYFAKIITGFTCGIGLLMPLFTDKKQTLHDMIAGCLALKK